MAESCDILLKKQVNGLVENVEQYILHYVNNKEGFEEKINNIIDAINSNN